MVALVAGLAMAGAASAQELWRGFRAGTPRAEVLAALPGAVAFTGPGSESAAPGSEPLQLDAVSVVDRPFQARLWFKGGGLNVVVLQHARLRNTESATLTESLLTALRAKYGRELSSTVSGSQPWGVDSNWHWVNSDTSIKLSNTRAEKGDFGQTYVTFSAGAKKKAENL